MNLSDLAPHLGIGALVIQTIIAIVYVLKYRKQRKRANSLCRRLDALSVDNTGLRAQNARLIQTVAKLRRGLESFGARLEKFNPEEEKE